MCSAYRERGIACRERRAQVSRLSSSFRATGHRGRRATSYERRATINDRGRTLLGHTPDEPDGPLRRGSGHWVAVRQWARSANSCHSGSPRQFPVSRRSRQPASKGRSFASQRASQLLSALTRVNERAWQPVQPFLCSTRYRHGPQPLSRNQRSGQGNKKGVELAQVAGSLSKPRTPDTYRKNLNEPHPVRPPGRCYLPIR